MKKAVALFLALIMTMSIVACGSNNAGNTTNNTTNNSSNTSDTDTGSDASRLVYGVASEITGDLGLGQWSSANADATIMPLIDAYAVACYDQNGLWMWDENVVAEHDSVSNEDGTLTYTIKLHDDLYFSDGTQITAKHYMAFPLLMASPVAIAESAYGTACKEVVGHDEYMNGESSVFSGLHLIDELTFSVTIGADYNPYYYGLALLNQTNHWFPLAYEQWLPDGNWDIVDDGDGCYIKGDVEFNAENCGQALVDGRFVYEGRVCSGPYYLESLDTGAGEAVLKVNTYYKGNFEGQKPSIETLVIKSVNSATMIDAVQTGSVDLIDNIAEGDLINACFDVADAGGFVASAYKYNGYMKLFYQCDWGPTQYQAVRQAIAYLTDRETLCQEATLGYGNVTNGQYSYSQWMAQEMEEQLKTELEAYPFDPDKAVELLKEDGWVYNADGSDYVDGSGEIRYKKVPEAETAYMEGCVEINGEWYMPLVIKFLGAGEGEGIETVLTELLTIYLVEQDTTANAGMQINKTTIAGGELLSYLNRRGANGEEKYTQPSYNMISLASGLGGAKFDKTYTWTFDEDLIANNKNRYFNEKLDQLSMDMIYGVEAGDDETFKELWFEYQKEYNRTLPEVPLFNWTYCELHNEKLQNFEMSSVWPFQYAILYATVA